MVCAMRETNRNLHEKKRGRTLSKAVRESQYEKIIFKLVIFNIAKY